MEFRKSGNTRRKFNDMDLKKIGVCGHFDGDNPTSSGQIIKTRIVTKELKKQLGFDQVEALDTHGGIKVLPGVMRQSWKMFKDCKNIIIMPAHNGIRIFVPLFSFYNSFFHRSIHYVVIGGWLDNFIDKHRWLTGMLKNFKGIYVETVTMRNALEKRGLHNVIVMPNFKDLRILKTEELSYTIEQPHKLCTFSRVCREKGIENAIKAVMFINKKYKKTVFTLDIYGQVDTEYKERFKKILKRTPPYVKYCGLVPFDRSVEVLKDYFALLFPTFYSGEGVAGTLIDAMAAGVPVVASDWRFNSEVVRPGKTGILVKNCNAEKLTVELEKIAEAPEKWNDMKASSLDEARKYLPDVAIEPLVDSL